jgi:Type II secretion system protein C
MTRPDPTSWNAIEATADNVMADVFSEVERLLGPTDSYSAPSPQVATHVGSSRRRSEWLMLGAAFCAAGLVGTLWITVLAPKMWVPKVSAVHPIPTPAEIAQKNEAAILENYQREMDSLAVKLKQNQPLTGRDPFSSPLTTPTNLAMAMPMLRPLPQLQVLSAPRPVSRPSILRLPPAPPTISSFTAPANLPVVPVPSRQTRMILPPPGVLNLPTNLPSLPPAPESGSRTSGLSTPAPAPRFAPAEPLLVGIVEEDASTRVAVIRIGENLKDYSIGATLKEGWTVTEIQANRVILLRNGKTRTLVLGGE